MFPTLQLSNTIVLNSYGICIGVGGLFGYMFLFFNSKNAGLNRDDLPLVYIISLVSAFLGGNYFISLKILKFI
jgi:prolipoprotein diacylglyceryltransferase